MPLAISADSSGRTPWAGFATASTATRPASIFSLAAPPSRRWRRSRSCGRRARRLGRFVPLRDRIAPGVRVLFVGINPGLRSEAIGHHFAGYSNRFWKLLFDARIVPERIGAEDDDRLTEWGLGITNLVP